MQWDNVTLVWTCPNKRYRVLIVESMDRDTEIRRISPVALSVQHACACCVSAVCLPVLVVKES